MASSTVSSDYTRTYTSFSGCDIVCTFGNTVIGELQAISYNVTREKVPIYTMGSPEVRSFSRGKRGIAGSLVFTVFDRDALIAGLKEHVEKEKSFHRIGGDKAGNGGPLEYSQISIDEWDDAMTSLTSSATNAENRTSMISEAATPVYADEIPPFDITISFANEYGQKATIVLYAVEIINEGTTFSIDHIVSEKACSFVARSVSYMKPVDRNGKSASSAGNIFKG